MEKSPFRKILVTGATGFLGNHVVPALKHQLDAEVVSVGHDEYDLIKPGEPDRMIRDIRPDAVIHLAARVGGIIANRKYPAEFFFENIVSNTQTFHACFKNGVKKFLTVIGGCSYPAKAVSPIDTDQMWEGFPQQESAPYSVAKKMMLIQSEAYRRQHGFNSVVLIPGNVYGEYDNFDEEYSHVIPAMIRRYLEAKEEGAPSIYGYGTGKPTRDFVYAGDVAAMMPWFLVNYDNSDPVNISSGTRISIRELAESIKNVVGYEGEIAWDTSKPDGQMDKIFSVDRLHDLGLDCPTTLTEGLQKTVNWFIQARKEGTVRI